MDLVTYLPFYRIHEVREYFLENVRRLGVKRAVVYVDNVYKDSQLALLKQLLPEVEVRGVNYRERNLTVVRILKDAVEEGWDALLVDSDNLLEPWLALADKKLIDSFEFYTVLNIEARGFTEHFRVSRLGILNIDDKIIEVYGWKVAGIYRRIPYFIGPKQAVRLSKPLLEKINRAFLEKLENTLKTMEPSIRGIISDETVLGMILYYSGVRETPFIIASSHFHHGSLQQRDVRTIKFMNAVAHAQLGARLLKYGIIDRIMLWYFIRYKTTAILRFLII